MYTQDIVLRDDDHEVNKHREIEGGGGGERNQTPIEEMFG